ncbi:MAG: hypothetical protein QM747_17320 [Nocardioides sp.]
MATGISRTTSRVRSALAVAATGCVVLGLATQLPAQAAPAAGTWTKISAPANNKVVLSQQGAEGHWTIRGTASHDVAEVNVYCLSSNNGPSVTSTTVATAVAVASGAFHTTVPVPSVASHCRLRALPDGVNPLDAYLASYAGPVVNLDSWVPTGSTNFGLTASADSSSVSANAAGGCGIVDFAAIAADQTGIGGTSGCLLSLQNNVTNTGASVVVDGHQAFGPPDDHLFGVTPISAVSVKFHVTKAQTLQWTEVEPLDRCASDVQWPPTSSCVLRTSGVALTRVSTLLKNGQLRIRDEFRSTDGKRHVLKLAYLCEIAENAQGLGGVRLPGQKGYHRPALGKKVKNPGPNRASTMLATADRLANDGDPNVSPQAISWSRRPARLVWSPSAEMSLEMDYRLVVPKGGSAHLGFADSVSLLTSGASALGAKAERDMMPSPAISAPRDGGVVHGTKTTVSGVVHSGANGLPVWVKVNGQRVKLKVRKSGDAATFTSTFSEGHGKHVITVVAKDAGGNKRSSSVAVRNE